MKVSYSMCLILAGALAVGCDRQPPGGASASSPVRDTHTAKSAPEAPLSGQIVFVSGGGQGKVPGEILALDLPTGKIAPTGLIPQGAGNVRLSPDGEAIAYSVKTGEEASFRMAYETSAGWNTKTLWNAWVIESEFAPDGSGIVFAGGPVAWDLRVARAPDWEVLTVTESGSRLETNPSWLADGSGLLYVVGNPDRNGMPDSICALDLALRSERTVYHDPAFTVGQPRQAKLGGKIAFTRAPSNQSPKAEEQTAAVCVVGHEGGEPTILTDLVSVDRSLQWRPAHEALSTCGATNMLQTLQRKTFFSLVEPQRPKPRALAENVDSFCWLPDGRRAIVSSGRKGERRLMLIDVDTGESRTLVQDRDASQPMFWSGKPL